MTSHVKRHIRLVTWCLIYKKVEKTTVLWVCGCKVGKSSKGQQLTSLPQILNLMRKRERAGERESICVGADDEQLCKLWCKKHTKTERSEERWRPSCSPAADVTVLNMNVVLQWNHWMAASDMQNVQQWNELYIKVSTSQF